MRRRVLIVLLFLLAGAVVNVAVAWGITVRPESDLYFPFPDPSVPDFGWYQRSGGWGDTSLYYARGKIVMSQTVGLLGGGMPLLRSTMDATQFLEIAPSWSEFHEDEPYHVRQSKGVGNWSGRTYVERAAGWPMLSLRSSFLHQIRFDGSSIRVEYPERHWLLVLPKDDLTSEWESELPCRPIPLGFAVNTAIYASLLYLPFAAFCYIRTRRLQRRSRCGLCPSCGYDLRGADHAVCPECGE